MVDNRDVLNPFYWYVCVCVYTERNTNFIDVCQYDVNSLRYVKYSIVFVCLCACICDLQNNSDLNYLVSKRKLW